MAMVKAFKVVQIGDRDLGHGCYHHLMIAADADTWQVTRNRDRCRPVPWRVGEVVEVAVRVATAAGSTEERFVAPLWETVQAANPIKYDLHKPYEAVTKAWGEEYAKRFFDPTPTPRRERVPAVMFEACDFNPGVGMSPGEKAHVGNQFVRFVESNFDGRDLTGPLYAALMRLFRLERLRPGRDVARQASAFHASWFGMASNRYVVFRRIADSDPNDEQTPGLSDLGRALRAYVVQRVMPAVTATRRNARAVRERGVLRQLLRKYGLPDDFKLPRQR